MYILTDRTGEYITDDAREATEVAVAKHKRGEFDFTVCEDTDEAFHCLLRVEPDGEPLFPGIPSDGMYAMVPNAFNPARFYATYARLSLD